MRTHNIHPHDKTIKISLKHPQYISCAISLKYPHGYFSLLVEEFLGSKTSSNQPW